MDIWKDVFNVGSPAWEVTVKRCLRLGFIIGLIVGVAILLKVL